MCLDIFKPVLTDKNVLKILQNAVFDMKVIKLQGGYYVENIYDTMLVEQIFYLGLHGHKADLATLIFKYLGITVDKEPRNTFSDYNQTFQPFQLEYAANDVLVLNTIRNMQLPRITKEGFENVCRLEFEFTKPMCEMELNGICFDADKQRIILGDVEKEKDKHGNILRGMFAEAEDQTTLFGVSLINIDSNAQLLKALNKSGFELESTDVNVLKKFSGMSIIDELLAYRKAQKFISTYGEKLIAKINPVTGRLHTGFRQMVSTGRMSSSNPNLQNIPKKQIYRSCFIAKPGYVLITSDMSGAELRIMGNLSADAVFVECYATGSDLHTRTASEVFDIPIGKVLGKHRNSAKAINFGLCYGLSKYGLARGLKISEKEAEQMINTYFERYSGIKRMLDDAAKNAIRKRYSVTVSGRKRFYNLPEYGHPDFKNAKRSVEREGKNAVIQGANADTIKEAMIYVVDRLEEAKYDAKLLLTVHDEVVVEVREDQRYEVAKLVSQSLVDGFAKYFSLIPMEADALIGKCWEVSPDKKCGGKEMIFVEDKKYGTKIICKKCGAEQ
jgi:DNA polymerase I-like protein with 3'-5' exonuclease and polymerase domains